MSKQDKRLRRQDAALAAVKARKFLKPVVDELPRPKKAKKLIKHLDAVVRAGSA